MLYKAPLGQNCPAHQVITKEDECWKVLEYFTSRYRTTYNTDYGYDKSPIGDENQVLWSNTPIEMPGENHHVYDVDRPAGCYWIQGGFGKGGFGFFNYAIDTLSTNEKNFVDRGGVCKPPGKSIRLLTYYKT